MSAQLRRNLSGNKCFRRWETFVGYTINELKQHLESKFKTGMSWENIGKWHIDHIVPISFFKYDKPEDQEFKYCWSLHNLQPLWARENLSKGCNTMEQWLSQSKFIVANKEN